MDNLTWKHNVSSEHDQINTLQLADDLSIRESKQIQKFSTEIVLAHSSI